MKKLLIPPQETLPLLPYAHWEDELGPGKSAPQVILEVRETSMTRNVSSSFFIVESFFELDVNSTSQVLQKYSIRLRTYQSWEGRSYLLSLYLGYTWGC